MSWADGLTLLRGFAARSGKQRLGEPRVRRRLLRVEAEQRRVLREDLDGAREPVAAERRAPAEEPHVEELLPLRRHEPERLETVLLDEEEGLRLLRAPPHHVGDPSVEPAQRRRAEG